MIWIFENFLLYIEIINFQLELSCNIDIECSVNEPYEMKNQTIFSVCVPVNRWFVEDRSSSSSFDIFNICSYGYTLLKCQPCMLFYFRSYKLQYDHISSVWVESPSKTKAITYLTKCGGYLSVSIKLQRGCMKHFLVLNTKLNCYIYCLLDVDFCKQSKLFTKFTPNVHVFYFSLKCWSLESHLISQFPLKSHKAI